MDKYEEALQRARELYETGNFLTRQQVGIIFPELRESEDERMRKRAIAILKYQRDYWSYDGPMEKCPPATPLKDLVDAIDVALSYLEKQKEQKPAEWSEEDERIRKSLLLDYEYAMRGSGDFWKNEHEKKYNWLKSLRPSWKPSEEQMKALWKLMKNGVFLSSYPEFQKEIESLYEHLKKLM